MRESVRTVRTGGKVVGETTVPVYETLDELVAAENEKSILNMFNKANAVRIMGNERAKHSLARIGKNKRFEIAYNLLWDILTPEEAKEVLGNIEKLKEVCASDRVQEAVDAYIEEKESERE